MHNLPLFKNKEIVNTKLWIRITLKENCVEQHDLNIIHGFYKKSDNLNEPYPVQNHKIKRKVLGH